MKVHAGTAADSARVKFLMAWTVVLAIKLVLATRLAPFVDEAFYAWEARHLAWAYSDLPGLTAWLIRLGVELGGPHEWALRAPFLLLGAVIPWQVVWLARRWFGERDGWQAGLVALAMPLTVISGVLAVPDVPLVFAALLCVDALARLQQRVSTLAALQLAVALAVGATAHYRFAAVLLAGGIGVLMSADLRAVLRSRRVWFAIAFGAAAWAPLLVWNLQHGGAGLGFQLVDRHPWQFHGSGAYWPLVQAAVLTPGLFLLLLAGTLLIWRRWRVGASGPWAFLLGAGVSATVAFWPLAFFVDSERLSLHWPHAGWLLLATVLPQVWRETRPLLRHLASGAATVGVAGVVAWLLVAATPVWRAQLADSRIHPGGFSGWPELAEAVAAARDREPLLQVITDNFKPAAQLVWALGLSGESLTVLDHPVNQHHGRAAQLALWGEEYLAASESGKRPRLLVVEDTSRPLKERLAGYQELCATFGSLPPPQVVSVDHGRKRFLLFRLPSTAGSQCVTPALAWIDQPPSGADVSGVVEVRGWALKSGSAVERVEITLDGVVVAVADYGLPRPDVLVYWGIPGDVGSARVGFQAALELGAVSPGRHWLGLVLHGRDGSREVWPEQPLDVRR